MADILHESQEAFLHIVNVGCGYRSMRCSRDGDDLPMKVCRMQRKYAETLE